MEKLQTMSKEELDDVARNCGIKISNKSAVSFHRGLRACWGIMGNQGKQKQDGGHALPVLDCFQIVRSFSFVNRETDAKNSSLENIR